MTPRSLEVRPTYRKRRLWPWIAAAGVLLALGLWEVRVQRARSTSESALPPAGSRAEPGRAGVDGRASARQAPVEGRVLTADGRGIAGVTVVAVPGGAEARTGEDGRFRLETDEGTPVRLEAHHSDLGFAVAEVHAPVASVRLLLQPRAGLEVLVLAGDRPISGAEVTVRQSGAEAGVFHADRTTDDSGKLRFLGLPGGPLEVEAVLPATGARGKVVVNGREGAVVQARVLMP